MVIIPFQLMLLTTKDMTELNARVLEYKSSSLK